MQLLRDCAANEEMGLCWEVIRLLATPFQLTARLPKAAALAKRRLAGGCAKAAGLTERRLAGCGAKACRGVGSRQLVLVIEDSPPAKPSPCVTIRAVLEGHQSTALPALTAGLPEGWLAGRSAKAGWLAKCRLPSRRRGTKGAGLSKCGLRSSRSKPASLPKCRLAGSSPETAGLTESRLAGGGAKACSRGKPN